METVGGETGVVNYAFIQSIVKLFYNNNFTLS